MFARVISAAASSAVLVSGLVLTGAPVAAVPSLDAQASQAAIATSAPERIAPLSRHSAKHSPKRSPKRRHPVFGSHPAHGYGHGQEHGHGSGGGPWDNQDWDDDWDDDVDWDSIDWDSIDWDNIDWDNIDWDNIVFGSGDADDDTDADTSDGEADDEPADTSDDTTPAGTGGGKKIRIAQANIRTSLSDKHWFADYRRVLKLQPDFITLNEANRRSDAALAVQGYAVHRSTHSPFTAETPVLWRTDRWIRVGAGTRYLTTRRVKWGVRAVNWVTVRSRTSNRTVSIISAHPAPSIPATRGLLTKFTHELGVLTGELAAQGPVFVGGDLNVGYQSSRWPASSLADAGLEPTYAALGRPARGTGDHGAIIDYLLYQPSRGVAATRQGTRLQNSDHHTVWADFTLRP